METQKVVFVNKELNTRLAGLLRLPDGFDLSRNYPTIVVTGPMLSVKEQAQSVYAARLTEAGYVTLVFDGTYFGESEGMPRFQELPNVKESDIEAAVAGLLVGLHSVLAVQEHGKAQEQPVVKTLGLGCVVAAHEVP